MATTFGSSGPTYSGPASVVYEHVDLAHNYADSAFSTSTSFLNRLANFTASVSPISASGFFSDVATPNSDFVTPPIPTAPVVDPVVISIPSFTPYPIDPTFDEIGPIPEFTATDPVLNLPTTPDSLDIEAPGSIPNITTDFEYPDAPTGDQLTLPDVPLFETLNLPDVPTVSIPSFSVDLPSVDSIGPPPGNTFNWNEVFYTDNLLEATQLELLDRITNGGTGLNPVVEQAIWDRARNREDLNSVRSAQELIVSQSARGFQKPSGALVAGLSYLAQETQNKNADLSREIAIKQAEMEQSNIQFALTSSIDLEGKLLSYSDSLQNRAFEAEKTTLTFALEIYKSKVAQFEVELASYKAAATVFEAEVRTELAKVEIYKSQIEAQGLINDINDSRVKLYVARLDGVKTVVDTYKAQIEAVNSRVQAETIKLDLYKSEVQAYGMQVSAKRDEFAIYSEQVRAELAKVSVYEAQAKAFAARIQAYSTQVDAEAKKVDVQVETSKAYTQGYLATVDGLIKQAEANQLQVTSAIDIYKGKATLFTAQVGAEEARVSAESKLFDLAVREATAKADIAIKNAEIAVANADNIAKLTLEAIKAGATVSSQLAASSLSAMNIGASISGSSQDIHSYQEK